MRSLALFLLVAAAACGPAVQQQPPCASSPATCSQHTGSGSDTETVMVCHDVADTGSLVAHSECHPVERDKDARDDDVRLLQKSRAEPTHHK